jgi:S-adenosylmethionine synthetase
MLSPLNVGDEAVEVVERKGLGHPDTICDALAETLSRNLCREYQDRFDRILHHNVDKVLLCGGCAAPAFGGGAVTDPFTVYLAGRATAKARGGSGSARPRSSAHSTGLTGSAGTVRA